MTVVGLPLGGPELSGIIALCVGEGLSDESGAWWAVAVRHGFVFAVEPLNYIPRLRPAVEAIEEVGSPRDDTVLLRIAASAPTWASVAEGGLVVAIDARLVEADGDEAVFIRYMSDMMALLRQAAQMFLPGEQTAS